MNTLTNTNTNKKAPDLTIDTTAPQLVDEIPPTTGTSTTTAIDTHSFKTTPKKVTKKLKKELKKVAASLSPKKSKAPETPKDATTSAREQVSPPSPKAWDFFGWKKFDKDSSKIWSQTWKEILPVVILGVILALATYRDLSLVKALFFVSLFVLLSEHVREQAFVVATNVFSSWMWLSVICLCYMYGCTWKVWSQVKSGDDELDTALFELCLLLLPAAVAVLLYQKWKTTQHQAL